LGHRRLGTGVVLASGDTRSRLREPMPMQALAAVRVKGRSAEVEVYRLD